MSPCLAEGLYRCVTQAHSMLDAAVETFFLLCQADRDQYSGAWRVAGTEQYLIPVTLTVRLT